MTTKVEEIQRLIIWYRNVGEMDWKKSWDCSQTRVLLFCMLHLQRHDDKMVNGAKSWGHLHVT